MKRIYLTLIIILTKSFISSGQQCDSCKTYFDNLLSILKQNQVTVSDLKKSWQITTKLYIWGYTDYDSVANNNTYILHTLTRTFSDICIKAGGNIGVDYYFKYMFYTYGSAEKEKSSALERLFVKFPEIVLKRIGENEELLIELSRGFINNRYYGAINPFDNKEYTSMTINENVPKPILNKNNCMDIFFEANPTLIEKYNIYKYQIDFIINMAISELNKR